MAQGNTGFGCKQWCWLLALAAGLIAAILLHRPMHGWFWPIVLGALVCLALGWLLTRFFCSETAATAHQPASSSAGASAKPAAAAAAAAAATVAATAAASQAASAAKANGAEPARAADIPPAAPAEPAPAAKPAAKPAAAAKSDKPAKPAASKAAKPAAKAAKPATAKAAKPAAKAEKAAKPAAKASRAAKPAAEAPAFVMQPVTRLKGEEDLAAQKGDWKYDGNGQPAAEAAKPVAKTAKPAAAKAAKPAAKAAKPAAEKAAKAAKPATRKAAAPKAAAPAAAVVDAAAVAAAGAGKKPRGLKQARNGKADDLKIIEGIGPAIEKFCNDLGIFHFDQIAGWGAADVAWMDQNIPRFPGRVSRDKWVSQARIIGAEGIPAFLERAKTNNY